MIINAPIVLRLTQDRRPLAGDTVDSCGTCLEVVEVWRGDGPDDWIVAAVKPRRLP